jgi:hypothetical protein
MQGLKKNLPHLRNNTIGIYSRLAPLCLFIFVFHPPMQKWFRQRLLPGHSLELGGMVGKGTILGCEDLSFNPPPPTSGNGQVALDGKPPCVHVWKSSHCAQSRVLKWLLEDWDEGVLALIAISVCCQKCSWFLLYSLPVVCGIVLVFGNCLVTS